VGALARSTCTWRSCRLLNCEHNDVGDLLGRQRGIGESERDRVTGAHENGGAPRLRGRHITGMGVAQRWREEIDHMLGHHGAGCRRNAAPDAGEPPVRFDADNLSRPV
jgi:hypothetical protein